LWDDGKTASNDGCSASCFAESCGDGVTQTSEACDDGNDDGNDGCSSSCAVEICGDGVTNNITESCDDGNSNNTDACLNSCEIASCGDGFVEASMEACDDGNDSDDDSCLNSCEIASCGDGVVHTGMEQCDDGNTSNGDGCSASCESEPAPSGDSSASSDSSSSVSSSVASSSDDSSASSEGTSSSSTSVTSSASSGVSSDSPQGGGGRGGSRNRTPAVGTGRRLDVMSNEVTHPAVPGTSARSVRSARSERMQVQTSEGVIILRDVNKTDDAASDIETVVQKGIMFGYRSSLGKTIGLFGSRNALTYGEFAKIAVKVSGVTPVETGVSANISARDTWAETFVHTAETLRWGAFKRAVDINAFIPKKAVMQILLDAAGIFYGPNPNDALRTAARLGYTSAVQKRTLSRGDMARIIVRFLERGKK